MTPTTLERELTWLYELTLPLSVETVLIHQAHVLDTWLPSTARRPAEQLLVRSRGDEADVALFLAKDVLEHLKQDDPSVALHDGNMQSFLHVLEGVSHFVCFAWNAQFDREISALELELQAEIDKFILCHHLLERQGTADANALIGRLFDSVRLDPELNEQERWRYTASSAHARRYCANLAPRLAILAERASVYRELRHFYRLSSTGKLAHIGII